LRRQPVSLAHRTRATALAVSTEIEAAIMPPAEPCSERAKGDGASLRQREPLPSSMRLLGVEF
jgi:hypothetical protein